MFPYCVSHRGNLLKWWKIPKVVSFGLKSLSLSHHQRSGADISTPLVFVAEAGCFPAASQRPTLQFPTAGSAVWCRSSWFPLQLRFFQVVEVLAGAGVLRDERIPLGAKPLNGAVEKLSPAGDCRYHPYNKVEAEEDGFLSRSGGEAVHRVGAREAAARELRLHLEAVELPLAH